VFCTELAACYRKLPQGKLKDFRAGSRQLYERTIKGIVHLRSDGNNLLLATVHDRKPPSGSKKKGPVWKWNLWLQPE
jgi:hypothetical protein